MMCAIINFKKHDHLGVHYSRKEVASTATLCRHYVGFGYRGRRFEHRQQYVVSLSKKLYPHCFSQLSCEMSTRWGQPLEGCSVLWAFRRNSTYKITHFHFSCKRQTISTVNLPTSLQLTPIIYSRTLDLFHIRVWMTWLYPAEMLNQQKVISCPSLLEVTVFRDVT